MIVQNVKQQAQYFVQWTVNEDIWQEEDTGKNVKVRTMDKELKKNDWFTGHHCPTCNEEIWHLKGDENYTCQGCKTTYDVEPQTQKEKEEKESAIKAIWEKTVIPDKIKAFKERKKQQAAQAAEEKKLINEIKREAKKEALQELKPAIKEKMKQDELARLQGKGQKGWAEKLAAGFDMGGQNTGGKKDIAAMMGMGTANTQQPAQNPVGQTGVLSEDKIASLLGQLRPGTERKVRGPKRKLKKKKKAPKEYEISPEEKIREMLS